MTLIFISISKVLIFTHSEIYIYIYFLIKIDIEKDHFKRVIW